MRLPAFLVRHGFAWLFAVSLPDLAAAESTANPAGHWEGAITLPATPLGVRVALERASDQSWQGTIDIPVQGLRGFKLNPVKVDGAAIRFALPGIPGDPQFVGRLAADAKTVTGDFTQGGQKFPFKLECKSASALAAGSNQNVKTVELPGLNHLFQTCQTGAISQYGQIEETFNPAAMQLISDWIRSITSH